MNAETVALVEELIARAELAMVETLNAAAEAIFEKSQIRVPKGDLGTHEARAAKDANYPEETLEQSGSVIPAEPGNLTATVIYDSPYAASQEVGEMVYERNGKPVEWVAEHYTSLGTGKRYLETSYKEVVPGLEAELDAAARSAFGELP